MKRIIYVIIFINCTVTATAQSADILSIRKYHTQNANTILKEYMQFLSIPNIAADTNGLHRNTQFIMQLMQQRDISNLQLLYPATAGAPPAVYGEALISPAAPTLIFYAHYDAQPVNPAQWAKGLAPFTPQLYNGALDHNAVPIPFPSDNHFENEWRLYARSASDDKAGIAAILNAYDAIKKSNLPLAYNIKFFFEGEEEAGSPHLAEILQRYSSLLQSNLWIICDGPVHQSGKKQIFFGVRGDAHLDVTVYASKRPLHSGHYGNWAPNPAMMLAKLLASMKDDNGRVTIKGFYDDVQPLSAEEKKALSEVPAVDEQLKNELGITSTEMKGIALSEAINLPSLNINGMQSGNVGKLASNQIPTTATAVIDLRLVMGNDCKRQQQKVIDHIKAQGYFVTDKEPTDEERKQYSKIIKVITPDDGYNAQRTPMNLPVIKKVINGLKSTTTDQVVLQPTMGGSLPLYVFEKYLHATTISVPIANYDNNQHAENENIRLQNLWDGIETMASLMLMK
ncbi:MAG: M20/M25/M40 family metallo-hydrolase [Bacteroidetes bacterium]|nr:M20/M25/M40 family metallo-hydrolase [Bacteroidota bacterium]